MNSIQEIFISIKSYFRVLPFVMRNGIWSFFLLPLLLNSLLLISLIYLAMSFSSGLTNQLSYLITGQDWLGDSWLMTLFEVGFSYLLKMILFYLVWQFYQLLSLIFLSPLFSYLSEKVQEALTGVEIKFSSEQFLKDVIRGVVIGVRNVAYQISWILVLYGVSFFVPFLSPFLPFALFVLGAYYYGFTMIDYRSEVFKLSPQQSRDFVNRHSSYALGNGIVFQFILFIPVVGTLFAPSFALVAAALGIEEINSKTLKIEA